MLNVETNNKITLTFKLGTKIRHFLLWLKPCRLTYLQYPKKESMTWHFKIDKLYLELMKTYPLFRDLLAAIHFPILVIYYFSRTDRPSFKNIILARKLIKRTCVEINEKIDVSFDLITVSFGTIVLILSDYQLVLQYESHSFCMDHINFFIVFCTVTNSNYP